MEFLAIKTFILIQRLELEIGWRMTSGVKLPQQKDLEKEFSTLSMHDFREVDCKLLNKKTSALFLLQKSKEKIKKVSLIFSHLFGIDRLI